MDGSSKDAPLYRLAARIIVIVGIILGVYLLFEYALPVLLPFLIAWLLSLLIRPLVGKLAGQKKSARGIWAALLVILFVGLTVWGIIKGCAQAVMELGRFMSELSAENSAVGFFFGDLSEWLSAVASRLPFLRQFSEHPKFEEFCGYLDDTVRAWAASALETLGRQVPAWIMGLAGQLPSVLIFATSLLLSCYYISADPQTFGERVGRMLPDKWQSSFGLWRMKLKKALGQYFRAYVILGLLTFGEMLLGLSILQVPYAFLLALVIALVDFLPLLGTGVILVPWALGSLLLGNGQLATGLFVIFGLHTLLRQILEPRLVSRELGLSPMASLIAIYAGWRLFGVGGMILAPLVLMVGKELLDSAEQK